jgi:sensor histidine kinase regulating citrate/malate metabolism
MGAVKIPPTTDDELRCAINAGQRRRATERRAMSVRYDSDRDAIEIELTDWAGVRLPRAKVERIQQRSAGRDDEAAGFAGRLRHQA